MADTKKYYWLKLHKDFFKRHDIRIIEAMENGKDYILFYLKLLVESVSHEGELRFSETIPYNEQMLSTITNTNIDVVRSAMKIFQELQMIEILEDSTIFMAEVDKMIGCETDWAKKKRGQRELPILSNGSRRLNAEMIRLPNGTTRFVDEKRYGGYGMFVLDRANGVCEKCGSAENVVIHHKNGYSNDPNDLICLCSKCHGEEHSYEGGSNLSTFCPPNVRQEIEIEKEIEKDKKNKKFIPPSVDDVKAYCKERNNTVDAQAFVDFYESKGWLIGKNKMKDWKAAVRTWERNRTQQKAEPKKNAFMNHDKRKYNFDELEAEATAWQKGDSNDK